MAKTEKQVKFAGFSQVSDETGKHSVGFHTSNQQKYAVWSILPQNVDGPGHSVKFTWFKLPNTMGKTAAIEFILHKDNVSLSKDVREFLTGLRDKAVTAAMPKQPKVKQPKAPKAKKEKVVVEVKDKTLSPGAALIKKLAEKRKASEAA